MGPHSGNTATGHTLFVIGMCLSAWVHTVGVLQLVTHYLLLAYVLLHVSTQWWYCNWSHTICYWHMFFYMGPNSEGTATGHTLFLTGMGPHSGGTATGHTLFVIGICPAWVHTVGYCNWSHAIYN